MGLGLAAGGRGTANGALLVGLVAPRPRPEVVGAAGEVMPPPSGESEGSRKERMTKT